MRYAIDGTAKITKKSDYDVVIVGAGIAGLYTALHLAFSKLCILLEDATKF